MEGESWLLVQSLSADKFSQKALNLLRLSVLYCEVNVAKDDHRSWNRSDALPRTGVLTYMHDMKCILKNSIATSRSPRQ